MDKEQRIAIAIAIAEACGWTIIIAGKRERKDVTTPNGEVYETYACIEDILPDYINDLNAMHDACISLPDFDWLKFWECLETITGARTFDKDIHDDCKSMLGATAAQRAEAFLRTLNLWKP